MGFVIVNASNGDRENGGKQMQMQKKSKNRESVKNKNTKNEEAGKISDI